VKQISSTKVIYMSNIGGVNATTGDIRDALGILTIAGGTMVKGPLAREGNPLAEMDYHAVARAEWDEFPGDRMPPSGDRRHPTAHVRRAVIRRLRRELA
jgi:hypothetical protein